MTNSLNSQREGASARVGGPGETFPWRRLLGYAHAVMGLAPEAVWRLSLVEWHALTSTRGISPLSRNDLAALMRRFPD